MNKLVYLFELDSRNKTSNTDGFYAIFQEIVHNGNCVAISMNQLTDSAFFTEALKDADTRTHLLKLFEIGALRISRYGEFRTASEYVQSKIEECKKKGKHAFIFSNMPIRGDDPTQLKVVGEALKNSDVNRIKEELSHCKDLDLDLICCFVDTILKISTMKSVMLPIKNPPGKTFVEFMDNIILSLLEKKSFADRKLDEEIKKAVCSLREREEGIKSKEKPNDRTNWLNAYKGEEEQYPLVITIINLCYNYTIQDSISGVCKSYDDQDFEASFWKDFSKRIKNERRKPSHSYKIIMRNQRWSWNMLIRFAEYRNNDDIEPGGVYTKTAGVPKSFWGRAVLSFFWAIIYFALFFVIELALNWLEERSGSLFKSTFSGFEETIISIGIFGLLGSLVDFSYNKVTKGREMPEIIECIKDLWIRIWDLLYIGLVCLGGLLKRIWDRVYLFFGGLYDKIRMFR